MTSPTSTVAVGYCRCRECRQTAITLQLVIRRRRWEMLLESELGVADQCWYVNNNIDIHKLISSYAQCAVSLHTIFFFSFIRLFVMMKLTLFE
jgi:hypothetical protein